MSTCPNCGGLVSVDTEALGVSYLTLTFRFVNQGYFNNGWFGVQPYFPPIDPSKFNATLDGNYLVRGTYGAYLVSNHSFFDSSTNTGSGLLISRVPILNGKPRQC